MLKFKQLSLHPLAFTTVYPLIAWLLFEWTKDSTLFVILICYVLGLVCITIHELGHMLAGYVAGMKLHFMSAGPLLLLPNKQGKIKVSMNSDLSMMLGMVSSYIPSTTLSDKELQQKMIPIYLGGPLANLLAIAAGFLIRLIPIGNVWLWDTTSYFIIINMALLFGTALPFGSYTDGANVSQLIRRKNMSLYREYNLYLNPDYKLNAQTTDDFEQRLSNIPQLSQCYNIGIMLIQYHTLHSNYEHSLRIIDQLISKLTKGDGLIMENLLYFYRGLLLWTSKQDIDQDTLMRLNNIDYAYGRTFCYLAKSMIDATKGKQAYNHQHLEAAKQSVHKIMDHRQEDIVSYCIQSVQNEMCA